MIKVDTDILKEIYSKSSDMTTRGEESVTLIHMLKNEISEDTELLYLPEMEEIVEHLGRIENISLLLKESMEDIKNTVEGLAEEYETLENEHKRKITQMGDVIEGISKNYTASIESSRNNLLQVNTETNVEQEQLAAITDILKKTYHYKEVTDESIY